LGRRREESRRPPATDAHLFAFNLTREIICGITKIIDVHNLDEVPSHLWRVNKLGIIETPLHCCFGVLPYESLQNELFMEWMQAHMRRFFITKTALLIATL